MLHHLQHGFRRGLSCETQLRVTYNNLAKTADKEHTTHAVVNGFQKALDKVLHLLLLQELQRIPGLDVHLIN